MSELAVGYEADYFQKNAAILTAIHDKMRILATGQPAASVTYDFATDSIAHAEVPTALDFLGYDSDFDRAEDDARANANRLKDAARWDGKILVSDTKSHWFSVARDTYVGRWESPEAKEAFHALNLRDPASVEWHQFQGYDAYGNLLRITSTVLADENGRQYAERVRLVADDGQARTITSLVQLEGEPIDCRREVTSLKDELVERIVRTVDRHDVGRLVVAIALGAVMDVSVDLDDVAKKYADKPVCDEVTSLIQDVRRYSQALRSAIDLRIAVGDTGRPSSEDLAELNVYLAAL